MSIQFQTSQPTSGIKAMPFASRCPDYGDTQRERTLIVPLSKLPADAPGWKFLLDLLRARKINYDEGRRNAFSTPAEPTSVQVEEALLAYNVRKRRED